MTEIRLKGRFHSVYILNFIRYGLFLCLIPMLQALIRFDMESLYSALKQDAVILIAMLLVAVYLWRHAGFVLTDKALVLCMGLGITQKTTILCDEIAVIELERPFWLRILGATRVIVYPATSTNLKAQKLFLSKSQAAAMAEYIMPVRDDVRFYHPSGYEQLALTVLSANVLTTVALIYFSVKETGRLLGANFEALLSALALDNLVVLEQWVELFLPAGVAWIITLAFVLWGAALFWSALSTANFKVSRSNGILLSYGGHINHSERRVRAAQIASCDVRTTIVGRILHRKPVYISAGAYTGRDVPILVYQPGKEDLVRSLLPHFRVCPTTPESVEGRSPAQYLWRSGGTFVLCLVLMAVSAWRLPLLTAPLTVPVVLSLGWLLLSLEAYFTEGVCQNDNHTTSLQYNKGYTRHSVCVFTPDVALTCRQTPFLEKVARCNLTLHLPCRKKVTVRGVRQYTAEQLKLG